MNLIASTFSGQPKPLCAGKKAPVGMFPPSSYFSNWHINLHG
jgi:hypothetical protein